MTKPDTFTQAREEAARPDFRVACVETAKETIGRLAPGARIVGLTKGQFSMLDLLRAVLDQTGPAHVTISTWTAGIRDIEQANWLIKTGDILSLRMLVDRSFPQRQPGYCRRLVQAFGLDALRVTFNHAKFALIQNDQWTVVVRGSMNLNVNKRWENFDVDADPQMYDFFARLVDELEYTTPAGLEATYREADDAFDAALADRTCGDVLTAQTERATRLARLGYSRRQVEMRLTKEPDDYERGRQDLEDSYREATVSAALGGDATARSEVKKWLQIPLAL